MRSGRLRSLNLRIRSLILSAAPCTDCGAPPDPEATFEFDHRIGIGSAAQRRMSDLITKGTSAKRFLQELKHCDIVCPTCHKKRTYNRGQWKRAA